MFEGMFRRLFGSANDRLVKGLRKSVDGINALEPAMQALSDEALRSRTPELRQRLENGETLDQLLPEAFAVVREAARRTLGQRHYDVQLVGGMVLHRGAIAEMKTGEGKTLVATLAAYLNALAGKGVHVVTVNDYLARRDSQWMGQIYGFLGMSVGVIVPMMPEEERRAAYACDITYATNNELGFDYLRDNMRMGVEQMVQRGHPFAIVDEVDSILVDEARTPLIISGPAEDSSELYRQLDVLIRELATGDWEKDEKQRTVAFTEPGQQHVQELLAGAGLLKSDDLYDIENITLVHHAQQALRAHKLFSRDVDYIVKDGKVVIIDEFTGRMMAGRRYSDGLHQALEAKEKVAIEAENQTLASVTFQNYFRLYEKLAGMTGTAATEAAEFGEIYRLDVVEMPTNVPMIRQDEDDEVYRTGREKDAAIVDEITAAHEKRQPVLVGTVSIEKSEQLSALLKSRRVEHQVLNARFHEQEAMIIAQAGRLGAVTIATNMAGRGTDIQLGGNAEMRIRQELGPKGDAASDEQGAQRIRDEIEAERQRVREAGGLYVIGTERHESRRIDNQLRGRSGRQGDPGRSKFFLSLEDDLMRIFGSERMDGMLQRLGLKEGEAIVHPWINKALLKAQQKVEARNFEIRKQLLKFDDVMNDQRKVVYEQRMELIAAEDVAETVAGMRQEVVEEIVAKRIPERAYAEQWDAAGLAEDAQRYLGIDVPVVEWAAEEGIADQEIRERLARAADERSARRTAMIGEATMRMVEKDLVLRVLDHQWKDHLLHLDYLRQGIHLRGYGQRDPLNEYKREAFNLFEGMLGNLRFSVVQMLSHVEFRLPPQPPESGPGPDGAAERVPTGPSVGSPAPAPARARAMAMAGGDDRPADPAGWGKVARNAACPCGSGKKYKQCHGRFA